ncbi:PLP-dependent aminotransferase family protein [Pseudorhodoplanes sp.]|uniref:aminotransferase-like domain-containing protein n=1 Tax=Pseudorhodoplanes sp. TaxID=1934341 RepID=UPI003D0E7B93
MTLRPSALSRGKPKYLALVDLIERNIASGDLRDGDRLPPQRELASDFDLTIATITKAIREAARRGIVTARAGSGTFIRVGSQRSDHHQDSVDLSLNTVPADPTKRFLDAAFAELAKRRVGDIACGYEPATGTEAHRTLMRGWLSARSLSPQSECILLTHGSQQALAACFFALTKPGDTILCEEWTYTGIRRLADLNQVRLEGVEMDKQGLVPRSLSDKLKSSGAKALICSAVVQNPTTATMPSERRAEIAALCESANIVIIEDDIYGHLSGEKTKPLAAIAPQNVIHISSMSKSLAPGIRLGTMVSPQSLVPALSNALVALHWTAPTMWLSLFEILVISGAIEKCLAAHRAEARRRLKLYEEVVGHLPQLELPSYHVWQDLPDSWRSEDFVTELAAQSIRVSPAHHFAVGTALKPQSQVRICLGGGDVDQLRNQLLQFRSVLSRPRSGSTII